jgi:hypothetical protein
LELEGYSSAIEATVAHLKITGKAPLSVQIRAEVSILGDVSTDLQ